MTIRSNEPPTVQEQVNIDLVRAYMEIAYTPGKASAEAATPLCAPENKPIAPTTFPTARTQLGWPLEECFAAERKES